MSRRCAACGEAGGFACPECNDHGGARVVANLGVGHSPGRDHDSFGADNVRSQAFTGAVGWGNYHRFSDDDLDWSAGGQAIGGEGREVVSIENLTPSSCAYAEAVAIAREEAIANADPA